MTFYQWLISKRYYCEICGWGRGEHSQATQVIKDEKGHEICVCDKHAGIETKEKYEHNASIGN